MPVSVLSKTLLSSIRMRSVQVTHQSGKGGEGFGEFTFLYLGWFFPTGLLSQNINIQQKP